jgi:hypothetical protein
VALHPARAQLAGPAQVEVYKTNCLDKILQPNEFTYVHDSHEGQVVHQCLARDVNLRGFFLMFGGMIAIAAVVATIARIPPVRFAGIIFIIFEEDSGDAASFPRLSSSVT